MSMKLPILSTPFYDITLPVSKKEVKFRPFLVKEEKALMLAQQGGNVKSSISTTIKMMENCIESPENLSVKKLSMPDFEYLLVHLRGKSKGEDVDVKIDCPSCKHRNDATIALSDIEISGETSDPNIMIDEDQRIVVTMRPVTISDFADMNIDNKKGVSIQDNFKIIERAIESVTVGSDDPVSMEDVTQTDIENFVDSLSEKQFKMLTEYVANLPAGVIKVNKTCSECGEEIKTEIKGLQAFFE